MRKTKKIAFLLIAFTLSVATAAKAEMVEISITATVNYLMDSKNYLEGKVHLGDTITGSYKYESTTEDSSPSDPTQGNYWHYLAPAGISLSVGGFNFTTNPDIVNFLVSIGNNASGQDNYLVRSYQNLPLYDSVGVGGIAWELDDYTASVFLSDALPATVPILSQWQDNYISIDGGGIGGSYGIHAEVTSAQLVPEPATILLFAIGTMFLRKRL